MGKGRRKEEDEKKVTIRGFVKSEAVRDLLKGHLAEMAKSLGISRQMLNKKLNNDVAIHWHELVAIRDFIESRRMVYFPVSYLLDSCELVSWLEEILPERPRLYAGGKEMSWENI